MSVGVRHVMRWSGKRNRKRARATTREMDSGTGEEGGAAGEADDGAGMGAAGHVGRWQDLEVGRGPHLHRRRTLGQKIQVGLRAQYHRVCVQVSPIVILRLIISHPFLKQAEPHLGSLHVAAGDDDVGQRVRGANSCRGRPHAFV